MYTVGTAAKATGKAKSTISRDIKRGRISATRNPDGSLGIDPAELHRVYPLVEQSNVAGNGLSNERQPPGTGSEVREIGLLHERIIEQAETIRDLRARLDDAGDALRRSAEERRQLLAMLTGPRAPWWRRWLR
jgi:hypothetical protein